ncbi:serine/threonine-protein kinase [Arthrobacter sp. zg-Y1143]|uniref:serine/threonine-protein kinase n=1 Tax=Arthrobacter sp. zg-Y1143 TaxID=3049065 RepID=UPI0024C36D5E|nr:serine/threonine-protein kinase [Arthrobacter sp. zg-Y1143]MDK1328378.1 protein kinase [Arthrobacter sp. zg-Y1143]
METNATGGLGRLIAGRYRLIEPIGHGGMATVYRGLDEALGRDIAVKLFRASAVAADDVGRQDNEMRLLASLSHPGLVTLFDAGKDDAGRDDGEAGEPRTYLVMELVEGSDLRKRLRETDIRHQDVGYIGSELAGALAYIHSRGVVHRDVKPANVLLPPAIPGTALRAKLTDFGIARIIDGARITAAGATLGTANYLSPEQASGVAAEAPSDIYSLGLVLLECVTGRVEFSGSAIESAVARLSRDPEVPASLDSHWRGLLAAMTTRDPDLRPTAAEVSAALLDHRWAEGTARTQSERSGPSPISEELWNGPATVEARTFPPGRSAEALPASGGPVSGPGPVPGPAPAARQRSTPASEAVSSDPVPALDQAPGSDRVPAAAAGEQHPSAPLPVTSPPAVPPTVGIPAAPAVSAVRMPQVQVMADQRPSAAARALLAVVVMAVLTAAVVLMLGRVGALPDGGTIPGEIGQNLQRLQDAFGR